MPDGYMGDADINDSVSREAVNTAIAQFKGKHVMSAKAMIAKAARDQAQQADIVLALNTRIQKLEFERDVVMHTNQRNAIQNQIDTLTIDERERQD